MFSKEIKYIALIFISLILVLKIVFYNEQFLSIIRIAFGIIWIFILPGYSILYFWKNQLEFIERIIISSTIGLGILGILAYYIGLTGLNINILTWILPAVIIGTSAIVNFLLALKTSSDV